MLSTWLNFGEILPRIFFLRIFSLNFKSVFPSWTFYLPYLRNGWSSWCETKRKWVNWMLCWLGYLLPWPLTLNFDLEFSRSNCISGMGGPIVMEWKGRESTGCPDVKHYGNESTGCCADWGTFDLEFSKSNWISGMGGSIVIDQKGQESLVCPDEKSNHYVTPRQKILLPTGWLKMSAFPSTRLVSSYFL